MLLLHSVWVQIREEFTEAELRAIRGAAVGETICPRALHIDADALDVALREKLTTLVLGKGER